MKKSKYYNPNYIAAITAFIAGIAIHLFGLVNVLHNNDDIYTQPTGFGSGVVSGRWFLEILGNFVKRFFTGHNVPFVMGMLLIVIVAISAYFIVNIFDIKNRVFAALIGVACVSFPSFTAIMFYRFTAVYYGVSIAFSVLAAYLLIKWEKHPVFAAVFAALLLSASMGIYQAYVPVVISLCVLSLIQQALIGEKSWLQLVYRGLYYCGALVLGLIFYFVFLKICLIYYDAQLLDYQGISSMGQLSLGDIPKLLWQSFATFFTMPRDNGYKLAFTDVIAVSYQLLGIISALMVGFAIIKKKAKPLNAALTVVLCLVFPVAVNFLVIMCANSWIYTLMVYAFVTVLFVPMVLFEVLPQMEGKWKKVKSVTAKVIVTLLGLIFISYAHLANVNYTAMYYSNRQVENYYTSMLTQIRMTEGFTTDKEWAFLGTLDDPMLRNQWQDAPFYEWAVPSYDTYRAYSWDNWIRFYDGYKVPFASEETVEALKNNPKVAEMPSWPNQGSIQVVDNTVVIKFSN